MGNWGQGPPHGHRHGGHGHVGHPHQPQPQHQRTQYQQPYGYVGQPGAYQYQACGRPAQGYVDPRYVGPQWAAPGPARQLQPRKKSSGLTILFVVLFLFFGVPVLFVLLGIGVAIFSGDDATTTTTEQEQEQPVTLPDTHALKPIVASSKLDATEEKAWEGGFCGDFSKERDRTQYFATRNEGSAKILKGKVAILNIHLTSPSLRWTKTADIDATEAEQLAQRFLLQEAARYRVTNLQLDVIPWALTTSLELPGLATNSNDLLDVDTMRAIRDASRLQVETALGTHLESVVTDLKKSGYQQVGFIIYFPVSTEARDFAFMAYNTQPPDDPELGFIFTPIGKNIATEFGHLSVTIAHEALHLFGADDLYRIRGLDKTDQHDVMGEYCSGFKQATLLDATAYSIGWIDVAPKRPYPFVDR